MLQQGWQRPGASPARRLRQQALISVMGKAVVKAARAMPGKVLCMKHAARNGARHAGAHP